MARARILIADDHPVVRRGLRSLLESQAGWTVIAEAANGREAVEQVVQLRPDVVVMDVTMPELNGLEAARQIVKASPGTEILILTMDGSEEVARQVLAAGARGFVLKSDADNFLIMAVDALRQHKPFLTPGVAGYVIEGFVNPKHITDDRLTGREREIVQLVAEGMSNKEVASKLGISVKTAETHRSNIMHKLNLSSVSDLVRYAVRNKIVSA